MGRRPKPKSDDFFERTPSVIEVIAILCLKPLNNCSTVWEHYPCVDTAWTTPDPQMYVSDSFEPPAPLSDPSEIRLNDVPRSGRVVSVCSQASNSLPGTIGPKPNDAYGTASRLST